MVTQSELRNLIYAARDRGAVIRTWHADNHDICAVEVHGVPGIGSQSMPLIQAAERLRTFTNEPTEAKGT